MVVTIAILAGCEKTPCENLRAHADSCDTPASRYVPEAQSSCALSREKHGPKQFDLFADCVIDSSCDTLNAVQQCRETHLPDTAASPCERFTLWGVGCGMEPLTQGPDCGGVANSLTAPAFEDWVNCVTQKGCPSKGDQRYATCLAEVFPKPVEIRLNTCNKIKRWSDTCGPLAPVDSPISFDLISCLVQGQVFTDESFVEYADCLWDMVENDECDSRTPRAICALNLKPMKMTGQRESDCARLIQTGELCPGPITGNSVSGCGQIFSRFTDASFKQYVDCVQNEAPKDPDQPCESSDPCEPNQPNNPESSGCCNLDADFARCPPLLHFTE
jgi:hypothetical protein